MIRVSCNGLCRIHHPRHGFLLGLNRSRLLQGKQVLMPLGGALQVTAPEKLEKIVIEWESHEPDLRFVMDEVHLAPFRQWFLRREDRETSPFRELYEELVHEFGVLPTLAESDVEIEYAFLREDSRLSDRSSAKIAPTHYFNEIYDVMFSAPVLEQINAFMRHSDELRWVQPEDITRGATDEKTAIITLF
jgi:hypothetical protein